MTTVTIFNRAVSAGSPWRVDGSDVATLHGLTEKINAYHPGGGTNMYTCLKEAADELAKPQTDDRKTLVVLMTDGQSETGLRDAALNGLRAAGVPVIAIAFGKDADPSQLKEVVSRTGGVFVQQDDLVAALRQ